MRHPPARPSGLFDREQSFLICLRYQSLDRFPPLDRSRRACYATSNYYRYFITNPGRKGKFYEKRTACRAAPQSSLLLILDVRPFLNGGRRQTRLIDISRSECIGRKRNRPLKSPLEQTVCAYVTCKVNYTMHRTIGRPTFPDARPGEFRRSPGQPVPNDYPLKS